MAKIDKTNVKSKKRYVYIFLSLSFFICVFIGLFFVFNQAPEKVALKYFQALENGNFKTAYECISNNDKQMLNYDDFLKKYNFNNKARQIVLSRSSHSVTNIKINGNEAIATVEVYGPDEKILLATMMKEFFPLMMKYAFSENKQQNDEEVEIFIQQKLSEKDIPMSSSSHDMMLVKENNSWKVNLNVKLNMQIDKLKREATDLEKQKKYNEAKNKYLEINSIKSNDIKLQKKIEELDKKIEEQKAKNDYIKKISLNNIKVFDYKEYSFSNSVKALKGSVVNNGSKNLSDVELIVYFYDNKGNIIGETTFHPLVGGFFEGNTVLKPNYVKDFGYKLEKYAPSSWSGKIKVEVIDITFQ